MALRTLAALLTAGIITETHLASGAVTNSKLGANAVDATKLDQSDDYNFTGALQVNGASVDPSQSLYYSVVAVAHGSNLASLTGATTSLGGATVSNGMVVLLFGQTTTAQNGLYGVSNVSGGTCDLTRITARDTAAEMPEGLLVYVKAGTHADKLYKLTSSITTLGSDPVIFEESEEGLSPLESSGEASALSDGDGSTVNFDLPSSGVVSLAVFVDGFHQPPSEYSISAGAGTGGVDRLVFGSAPASGAKIEVIGFKRV